MQEIAALINKFSSVPVYIVVGYCAFVYRELPDELRRFSYYVFISGFIQLASTLLWWQSQNNLPLLHIYVAVGFFCLALFYQKVLDSFIDKKLIFGITIVFLVFTFLNSVFIQPIWTFNSYALIAECVLVVILSLSTFIVMLDDMVKKERKGLARSLNWINSGLFVYYSSSLIIFYITQFLTKEASLTLLSKTLANQIWMLHAFFSLIMYSCFLIGLWFRPKDHRI